MNGQDEMEELMTVEAVARLFNVSPRTVVRLVERRQMRAIRIGRQWRFRREWIDAWLDKNTQSPQDDVG
jgi:excisionase family DNA binding protein